MPEINADVRDPNRIYNLVRRGEYFETFGKYQDAIEVFDKVLEIDPGHIFALVHKGISLAKLDRHDEAIEILDKALEISPLNSFALANKAASFAYLGRYKEAIVFFNKAIEIEPENTKLFSDRGALLRATKRRETNENIKFYRGHLYVSYIPGINHLGTSGVISRTNFVDLCASLFADRMLLDESEEVLRATSQDMIDRWSKFSPETREQQYKLLKSVKSKEPQPDRQDKIPHSPTNSFSDRNNIFDLFKVFLILAAIFIFIVGLVTITSGGLKESTPKKRTPAENAEAINECTRWYGAGHVVYDDQGKYYDCR